MDFFSALRISASGLSVQRTRVNLATSNLANAETTRGADGQPYRRLDPVLEAAPFDIGLAGGDPEGPMGVRVAEIGRTRAPGGWSTAPTIPMRTPTDSSSSPTSIRSTRWST